MEVLEPGDLFEITGGALVERTTIYGERVQISPEEYYKDLIFRFVGDDEEGRMVVEKVWPDLIKCMPFVSISPEPSALPRTWFRRSDIEWKHISVRFYEMLCGRPVKGSAKWVSYMEDQINGH